jgi:hypothetical protein
MKLKVYEVGVIRFDEVGDAEWSLLYADYPVAVKEFKSLIKEAKQIDWIKEGLKNGNEKYILRSTVDYWSFHIDRSFEYKSYEVYIKEREVF